MPNGGLARWTPLGKTRHHLQSCQRLQQDELVIKNWQDSRGLDSDTLLSQRLQNKKPLQITFPKNQDMIDSSPHKVWLVSILIME